MSANPFAPFVGPFKYDPLWSCILDSMGAELLDTRGSPWHHIRFVLTTYHETNQRADEIGYFICSLLNEKWERVQKENSAKRADEIANRRLNQIFGEKENQKEEKV